MEKINLENMKLEKETFHSILEAETKDSENNVFLTYFTSFNKIISKFTRTVEELSSKANIQIENMIDTYRDAIEDPNVEIQNIPFKMNICKFKNLTDNNVPNFEAKKLYQREIDDIAKLIQDLGPVASEDAKIKIIASVYNSLNKEMNGEFIDKCASSLIGSLYDRTKSSSEQIYNLFRDECELKKITKPCISEAKNVLMNGEIYISYIKNIADRLISDFSDISRSISDMLFMNKSHTLKVNTESDGIINRDYPLNTYSMNQFNMFMKAKAMQLTQIVNLYIIAYSIKVDSIIDFLTQNKEIVRLATENTSNIAFSDETSGEELEPEDVDDDDNEDMDQDNADDTIEVDDIDDDVEVSDDDDTNDNIVNDKEIIEDEDLQKEAYLFDCELFNMNRAVDEFSLQLEMFQAIHEEDLDNLQSANDDATGKVQGVWNSLVSKLTELFNKFNDIFIKRTKFKIDNLEKHQDDIAKNDFSAQATMKHYDTDRIKRIQVQDLNYENMKEYLQSKEAYIKQYYGNLGLPLDKNNNNFTTSLKKWIKESEDEAKITISKDKMYDYCVDDYQDLVDEIRKQKELINKAQKNSIKIAKQYESDADENKSEEGEKSKEQDSNSNSNQNQDSNNNSNNNQHSSNQQSNNNNSNSKSSNTVRSDGKSKNVSYESVEYKYTNMYFNEFTDKGKVTKQTRDINKQLMVYFSVSSQALSVKMSMADAAFKEFYAALKSLF